MLGLYGNNVIRGLLPALLVTGILKDLPNLIQRASNIQKAEDAKSVLDHLKQIEEYDYVIVGAGSAGAVVANRLSKDRSLRILVLQDGGDPNPFVQIPGLSGGVTSQPSTDYDYKIVKQKNACMANNSYTENCNYSRGIGLGGTSNINSMSVARGNPRDYDAWAEITKDPAWAYKNVLNIFKKQENYHGYFQPTDRRFHGEDGESYVSAQQPAIFPNYFYQACGEMGLRVDVDANANQTVGCGHLDLNIKDGKRWGSYDSFLKPILGRSNLKIYRYAKATKINFDGVMRATGVTYTRHGISRYVKAKHEVILCAGAIDSPKLLMLSGIGPAAHLQSVGIKPLLDLPVGVTFHDHVGVGIQVSVNRSKIAFIPERDLTPEGLQTYLQEGRGPPASPLFNSRIIAYATSKEFNSPNWPDIELRARAASGNTAQVGGTYLDKFSLTVQIIRTLSSGELKLASSNANDPPVIDPKLLSDDSDARRLVEGLEFALGMLETKTFRGIDARMIPVPNCGEPIKNKTNFECIVRQNTLTACRPMGTVKMGAKHDPRAVLDSKLRVRGVEGLRVVDCSIMPRIISGHLHSPAMMIGEMGANFILNERQSAVLY